MQINFANIGAKKSTRFFFGRGVLKKTEGECFLLNAYLKSISFLVTQVRLKTLSMFFWQLKSKFFEDHSNLHQQKSCGMPCQTVLFFA